MTSFICWAMANINGTGNIKANAIFGNIADNIPAGQGSDSPVWW